MAFSGDVRNQIKSTYQSSDLAQDFYNPVLSEADTYKRVSAYFSSDGLALYSNGLERLFNNGGFAKFIISTDISEEDFLKIQQGYEIKRTLDKLAPKLRRTSLTDKAKTSLGNLAFMIAAGCAEVKFAVIPAKNGIFHDKFGLIYSDKDAVFFNGSANETRSGLGLNYESISVDVSWDSSTHVQSRIKINEERFARLWKNTEPGVCTLDATEIVYSELKKYQQFSTLDIATKFNQPQEGIFFYLKDGYIIIRQDNTINSFTNHDRKLKPDSDLFNKYFEKDNSTIKSNFSYRDIEYIIAVTKDRCDRKGIPVSISKDLEEFLKFKKYSIEEYRKLGLYLKRSQQYHQINGEKERFDEFVSVVNSEVVRPFKNLQLKAAFYEYRMARAANFSVPGSGKTAMILAVFAYLNSLKINTENADSILVVCPINAFNSWKYEFCQVFGEKKELKAIDSQTSRDFNYSLTVQWKTSNLILVNYEALVKHKDKLKELISPKTMIVFDEVHRIKNPLGVRAQAALEIAKEPQFKFVLTGTPIPNSYQDIYNFLHLLYSNEYTAFFGWELNELKNPTLRKIEEINKHLAPFFWRINKKDLNVPEPEPDVFLTEEASGEQKELAQSIFCHEKSSLARLIRLMQASTNPALLTKEIDYLDLGFVDDNDKNDTIEISKSEFYDRIHTKSPSAIKEAKHYGEYDLLNMISPKFERGIQKIQELVSEGKKVIVWAIFIDTMKKIQKRLNQIGLQANLVYGGTNVADRQGLINDFRFGKTMVMISNPQTLGESISLHKEVHDALYFEYSFNLTFLLQSRDRIHRLGLDKNQYTRYYFLQTKSEPEYSGLAGYVDEKIYDRLMEKQEIMYNAINSNKLIIEFSPNEIDDAIKIIDEERHRIARNKTQF